MDKQDAKNMKEMIDLQWVCISLATMSGAAGDPGFLVDPFDSDPDSEVET